MDFSDRSSPLLSSLGIVALASVVSPFACSDGNGSAPPPIDDIADVIDVYESYLEFYCECYAELYSEPVSECLAETEILDDAEEACLTEIFDANPAAFAVVRCQAEVARGLLGCAQAEGCPSPFTCGDGSTVPEDFVCDGYPDCEDGTDEEQGCPPPKTCASGDPIPEAAVCDGFTDCADESDELDCPPPPPPLVCDGDREIPPYLVCDAERNCADGTDEEGCPETCERRWLLQRAECGDLSDEVSALVAGCYDFVCFDGTEIPNAQVCDGTAHCPDGEDEQLCEPDGATSGG